MASEAALEAIREADLIVIGPGSLYTSVIPNFLLQGVSEAVAASQVPKVFVCNVATQPHETDGYGVAEHIKAFHEHSHLRVTHVLANSNVQALPEEWDQKAIVPGTTIQGFDGYVILADVADENFRTRHHPQKLARTIMTIAQRSQGQKNILARFQGLLSASKPS